MKTAFYRTLVFIGLAALTAVPALRAQAPNLSWGDFNNMPSAGTTSTAIPFTVSLTNTGDITWGTGFWLELRELSAGARIDTEPLPSTANGSTVVVHMTITLPATPGTYTYRLYGLWQQQPNSPIYNFGPYSYHDVTVTQTQGSVSLSSYTFLSSRLPTISTSSDAVMPTPPVGQHKLRTKVLNVPGYPNGFHMTDDWNNNGFTLKVAPPPLTYTAQLYWLKYDPDGNNLLEIGPFKNVNLNVAQSQVQLTAYWFNVAARPAISNNEPIPPQYKLAAQVLYGTNGTLAAATSPNNQGYYLDQPPAPGTYQVQLFWQKFDVSGTTVIDSGPLRTETITVTDGPIPMLNTSGHIDAYDNDDGGTDYSGDIYDVVVPTAGQLSLSSSGMINLWGFLFDPSGNLTSLGNGSGNFNATIHVLPGTYRLLVAGVDSDGDYGVSARLVPDVPPPAVNSATIVTAPLGVPFYYTITTNSTADARYAGGLPSSLGLTCNPSTGVISGTPMQAGIYSVQLYATRDGLVGPTTTLALTVATTTTLAKINGDNQSGEVGQFNNAPFDVAAYNTADITPRVGKPVVFTVQSGGGQLAITNVGNPALSSAVTVNTDSVGTAQVYYKQPATADVQSQITASSEGTQATFTTQSVAGSVPVISSQPISESIVEGGWTTFTVAATVTSGAITYQWQRASAGGSFANLTDDSVFSGTTSPTLTLSGAATSMNGDSYRVVMTGTGGSVTSAAAALTVNAAPVISSGQTVTAGQTATLTVTAPGATAIQWFFNGVALANGGGVSGATTTTLTVTGAQAASAGVYSSTVSYASGATATSGATALNVLANPLIEVGAFNNEATIERGELALNRSFYGYAEFAPSGSGSKYYKSLARTYAYSYTADSFTSNWTESYTANYTASGTYSPANDTFTNTATGTAAMSFHQEGFVSGQHVSTSDESGQGSITIRAGAEHDANINVNTHATVTDNEWWIDAYGVEQNTTTTNSDAEIEFFIRFHPNNLTPQQTSTTSVTHGRSSGQEDWVNTEDISDTLSDEYTLNELKTVAVSDYASAAASITVGKVKAIFKGGGSSTSDTTLDPVSSAAGVPNVASNSFDTAHGTVTLRGSKYHLKATNPNPGNSATFHFAWREVFYPDSGTPSVLNTYDRVVTGSAATATTEDFSIAPPATAGRVDVEFFNPVLTGRQGANGIFYSVTGTAETMMVLFNSSNPAATKKPLTIWLPSSMSSATLAISSGQDKIKLVSSTGTDLGQTVALTSSPSSIYVQATASGSAQLTLTVTSANGGTTTRLLDVSTSAIEWIAPAGDPVNSAVDAGNDPNGIPDGSNEFTYSTATTGVLTIKLKAHIAGISNATAAEKAAFRFSVDAVGNSTLGWVVTNPSGAPTFNGDYLEAKVAFTGLPQNNSDFGTKHARVLYAGVVAAEATYEVFFPRDATNHPAGQAGSPNWFYYWGQVAGITNVIYGGSRTDGATAETTAMTQWSYTTAPNKTQVKIYQGVCDKFRAYGVGKEFSGIDRFIGTLIHEEKHVDQIARADALLPTNGADSFRFGWSWNTAYQSPAKPHNHWKPGPDGKWGRAGVDDDGNGVVDDAAPIPPFEPGNALSDDEDLDYLGYRDWPKSWTLPPLIYVDGGPIESEAINSSDAGHSENQSARSDWGNPGKNHQTLNKWDN